MVSKRIAGVQNCTSHAVIQTIANVCFVETSRIAVDIILYLPKICLHVAGDHPDTNNGPT